MRNMSDHRQYAPATLRNRDFILDVLREVLPVTGAILEIASGSGEHVVHFARSLPSLVFQPSDPDPEAVQSVAAWVNAMGVTNVRAPIVLDASRSPWPIVCLPNPDIVFASASDHGWEADIAVMFFECPLSAFSGC